MSDIKTILFIGKDDKYWNSLQERFKKSFPQRKHNFQQLFREEDKLFQKLIIDITQIDPDVIFIDYTTEPGKLMTLARLIRRCFPHIKAIIGLWDLLVEQKFIKESNITGVFLNHIKSGEFSDIIYHAEMLSENERKELPKNAVAPIPIEYPVELATIMKVGFVTQSHVHVENNFNFQVGTELKLKTHFGKYFKLEDFVVNTSDNKNLFYSFKHCHNLRILFKDELTGEIDPKTEEPIVKTRAEFVKKRYLEWFVGNIKNSALNRNRVLIIDPSLKALEQAEKPLDGYTNSIRFNSNIDLEGEIIPEVLPGFIIYTYKDEPVVEEPEEGEEEMTATPSKTEEEDEDAIPEIYGNQALSIIISKIKTIEEYSPFILVFNSKRSSEELRSNYEYTNIIGDSEEFNFDKVISLCDALNSKMSAINSKKELERKEKLRLLKEEGKEPPPPKVEDQKKYFLDKNSEESNIEYIIDCQLKEVSESYITFVAPTEIPMYTVFHVEKPIQMYVTVIPIGEDDAVSVEGGFQYLGVNHGISETERAQLRRFVNEMIYLPKQLEKNAEMQEFEDKKKEFKQKEEEARKKAEEEAKEKEEKEES